MVKKNNIYFSYMMNGHDAMNVNTHHVFAHNKRAWLHHWLYNNEKSKKALK